ncbi:MAG: HAD hydrolase-like protein, partial [Acidobacteriota bacterium]|nr:HAD hydrolase-like protein [Acidobacteriota bacterium]
MLAGVIFDFDGVIANSEPLHLRAYQDVLECRGVTLSSADYYERYLGFDDVGVFREIAKHHGCELTDETLEGLILAKGRCYDTLAQHGDSVFPGAPECIARIAEEVPIAIASGALAP